MYLECINENLNTLILNQEMTYFIMQEILKKMDRSMNKRHVKVRRKKYKFSLPARKVGRDFAMESRIYLFTHAKVR